MILKKYLPSDYLKPFIKFFMIIESESGMINRILPDTSLVMAFRYKGDVKVGESSIVSKLPTSVITGLRNSPRILSYAKDTANLLVVFNEGCAVCFFKEPLNEFFETSISLENLVYPQKLKETEKRIAESKSDLKRIAVIENLLLSIMKRNKPDMIINDAVQRIKSANGNIKIRELASSLNISQDPFEKRFRRAIGTSPKLFSRVVRMRSLINHYPDFKSLTEAAYFAGYYDQAHFIKDFRTFTGQVPKEFFKASSYW